LIAECGVRPSHVVRAQPRLERPCATSRGRVRPHIRPFSDERLNEALGFAVGLWPIRTRAFELDPSASGDGVKVPTAIVTAVIGQDTRDANAAARKPVEGALEEAAVVAPV
jgi:hypothetical protein